MYKLTEEIKEKYIKLLCSICMIETPSDNKKNIDKMVDLIQNFVAGQGFETERFAFENAGDFLLIKAGFCTSGKPVLLMAHMDTVHKEGAFGESIVTRDGDWMLGPGVMDCKGGIATGLCVIEILKTENKLKRPVFFLLTSDEEVSGRFSGQKGFDIITNVAKKSCAVFNLEPGMPGAVTVGRKGILRMVAEIYGVSAHAGNGYFEGASAITEAAHMILETEQMSRKNGTTFNCGVIRGGTVANTVADKCCVEIDIRASSNEEMASAEAAMYDLAKRNVVENTHRTISVISKRPPMEMTEKNIELLNKWNTAARALGLQEYKGIKKGGGSDAAYTVLAGVPTLCSCAAVGFNEHTVCEKLDLSTFDERVALICNTINLI